MKSRRICGLFAAAAMACAQSRIDISKQVRNPDFSGLAHTRPLQVGSTLPASCEVGELFFNSSAPAGSNIYSCASTNVWAPTGSATLGSCTVSNNSLTCPGGIQTGTGGQPGSISLYEVVTNGGNSVSLAAPAAVTGSYTLQLPPAGPQAGQTLLFGQPDSNGDSQASWITPGVGQPLNGTGSVSLYGAGSPSNSISIAVPAAIPGAYTLQLPATPPQSGQSLAFGAPDTSGVSQASWLTPPGSQVNGGANLSEGLYAGLPASCMEGSLYLFTDSLYSFARCTSGAWLHFFDGKAITPPSGLTMSSLLLPSTVTLNASHGYEQLYAAGGGSVAFRAFPATATAPYTKYMVLRVPAILDQANYRSWYAGFADPSGNTQVLGCGVGIAVTSGFWCRVTRFNSSGGYVGQDTSAITVPYFTGTVIVALQNDGIFLHFGISTDASTFYQIGSPAVASYLSSPASLVYGVVNSATGQNLAVNFLGVY